MLMVITAGIWAAFQKDLSRLLGYAVIVETGFSLLALSMVAQVGKELFSAMFIPRMIGFGLWALSLSILMRGAGSTRFDDVAGLAQRMPVASAGLAVASLTLGGLPVLPVFPIHQVILEELARQSLASALWVLVGSGSLLFSTFRSLAVLARGSRVSQPASESRLQIALIIAGIAGLLLIGIFPQFFMPMLDGLTSHYNLLP
jgi:multicomponent Na+:H+ antiporter subunit D